MTKPSSYPHFTHFASALDELAYDFLHRRKKILAGKNSEEVHQLRVDVKRMRAMISFLERFSDADYSGDVIRKLLKEVYKPAGRLRDIHICRELTEKHEELPGSVYLDALAGKAAGKQKRLLRKLSKFNSGDFTGQIAAAKAAAAGLSGPDTPARIRAFIRRQAAKVRRLLQTAGGDEHLHEMRKRLKKISGILKLLEEQEALKPDPAIYDRLKNLEDRAGEWHDNVVLLASLRKPNPDYSRKESRKIRRFIRKLEKENRREVRRLRRRLRRFLRLINKNKDWLHYE